MVRFDHVSVILREIAPAEAFFLGLGFEREGSATVSGEVVDQVNGLSGVRSDIVMLRTPDGSGKLELVTYHTPESSEEIQARPSNALGLRHICLEVEGLTGILERLRGEGYELVGELANYENVFQLCYVRGPEGMIVELAERIGG